MAADRERWYRGEVMTSRIGSARLPHDHKDHAVQFYRDDAALMTTLSRFVRDGLNADQPLVVIATAEHRDGLVRTLRADGVGPARFEKSGSLWLLDARETLESFMAGGTPDPILFHAKVGSVIELASGGGRHTIVRAYGEMVDLLWKDGNPEAAIQLEGLWNGLADSRRFALLCAYDIGNFSRQSRGFDIGDVCQVHTHVLPA